MLKDSNAEIFSSPPPPPMHPQHFYNIFRYHGYLYMIYDILYPLFELSVGRFSTCSQTTVQVSKDIQILNTHPTATHNVVDVLICVTWMYNTCTCKYSGGCIYS